MRINDLVFNDGTTFGIMAYSSLVIHELCHLSAMRALFTNIDPYLGCNYTYCFTQWNGDPVIRPELSISQETGRGFVSLAGPVSDLIGIAISSLVAINLRNSNQKLAKLFAKHAFALSLNSCIHYILPAKTTGIASQETDYAKVEQYLGLSEKIQLRIAGSLTFATSQLVFW